MAWISAGHGEHWLQPTLLAPGPARLQGFADSRAFQPLTTQISASSTGVLLSLIVAVSSPYAVFTAAELGWPFGSCPSPGQSKRVAAPVLGAKQEPSGKQRCTGVIRAAMVQGELFLMA